MATHPKVIYCASGNKDLAQIAVNSGMLYGARLPGTTYLQPWFVDQDWKNPNLEKYLEGIRQASPTMATILDWEEEDQREEVFSWAHEVASCPSIEIVAFIPKVSGTIPEIPYEINGKRVILAYSVPTSYGGTTVPLSEFGNRQVHLLGGNPHDQMKLCDDLNVVSVDGNITQKMAIERMLSWCPYTDCRERDWWQELADDYRTAFRISCDNVMTAWHHRERITPLFRKMEKISGFRRYKHSADFYRKKCEKYNQEIIRALADEQ